MPFLFCEVIVNIGHCGKKLEYLWCVCYIDDDGNTMFSQHIDNMRYVIKLDGNTMFSQHIDNMRYVIIKFYNELVAFFKPQLPRSYKVTIRPTPIVLKILPIILSRISQKFCPLFF